MIISFLSDYGYEDEFVGVCHGVIARLAPQARVLDLGHGIPRHDVRAGALTLAGALDYLPPGIHLAIVDPEVGAGGEHARRAVAVRCALEQQLLVGPDNGLLWPAIETLGGPGEVVDIGRSRHRLEPVSATFHGRDIFAPVAAALARGEPLAGVGDPFDGEELQRLELPRALAGEQGGLLAHVLTIDRFGNVALDAGHEQLGAAGLRLGDAILVGVRGELERARFAVTFADVEPGALLLYEDARRMAALAINRGSAAQRLGLARDEEVLLLPAPAPDAQP